MHRDRRKGVNANAREVEILTVVGNGIKMGSGTLKEHHLKHSQLPTLYPIHQPLVI
jgi:hypothetical protein